jgi:uncharacterized protein YbjT (DUF2867 family)
MTTPLDVLITGGTGYIGRNLIPVLLGRGHRVRVLARSESADRVAAGATPVIGDALDATSVANALHAADTVVHLVGTPHPTPSKADQFEKVDLMSIRATVAALRNSPTTHLVYVSVAQPAPLMQSYLWVRTLGETMIREAGLTATILRPWYILGPGRRWPMAIMPLYKLAELIPGARATAQRLGLVTLEQFIQAMVAHIENPPARGQWRIIDVPEIKRACARTLLVEQRQKSS